MTEVQKVAISLTANTPKSLLEYFSFGFFMFCKDLVWKLDDIYVGGCKLITTTPGMHQVLRIETSQGPMAIHLSYEIRKNQLRIKIIDSNRSVVYEKSDDFMILALTEQAAQSIQTAIDEAVRVS